MKSVLFPFTQKKVLNFLNSFQESKIFDKEFFLSEEAKNVVYSNIYNVYDKSIHPSYFDINKLFFKTNEEFTKMIKFLNDLFFDVYFNNLKLKNIKQDLLSRTKFKAIKKALKQLKEETDIKIIREVSNFSVEKFNEGLKTNDIMLSIFFDPFDIPIGFYKSEEDFEENRNEENKIYIITNDNNEEKVETYARLITFFYLKNYILFFIEDLLMVIGNKVPLLKIYLNKDLYEDGVLSIYNDFSFSLNFRDNGKNRTKALTTIKLLNNYEEIFKMKMSDYGRQMFFENKNRRFYLNSDKKELTRNFLCQMEDVLCIALH